MRHLVAALLVFWEPLRFAVEALGLLTTITYRGVLAAVELFLHGGVAALSAAAGLALWNSGPHARHLGLIAVMASVVRNIQSVYWSSLPDNTPPGDELPRAAIGVLIGAVAAVVILGSRDRP